MCWVETSSTGPIGDRVCWPVLKREAMTRDPCAWVDTSSVGDSADACWARATQTEVLEARTITKDADDVGLQLDRIKEARQDATEDNRSSLLFRWIGIGLEKLDQLSGVGLGMAYTILGQISPTTSSDSGGGDFDFFGRFRIGERGAMFRSVLGFNTEVRHDLGGLLNDEDMTPIGGLTPTAVGFNQQPFSLTVAWWELQVFQGRWLTRLGKLDSTETFGTYRFDSINMAFQGVSFSGRPAMSDPQQGAGIATTWHATDLIGLSLGLFDAAGVKTDARFMKNLIEEGAVFFTAELALTPEIRDQGHGAYKLDVWYSEAVDSLDKAEGAGVLLSVEQAFFADTLVPFVRYGYSSASTTPARHHVALGFGIERPQGRERDRFALGMAWNHPNDETLRDQYDLELFYRFQIGTHLQLSPGGQMYIFPAQNPEHDVVGLAQLRVRVEL